MKKRIVLILLFLSTYFIYSNSVKPVKDISFGENLFINSMQGDFQYIPKLNTNGYNTGIGISLYGLNILYNANHKYPGTNWNISAGPNFSYYILDNIGIRLNLNFGYTETEKTNVLIPNNLLYVKYDKNFNYGFYFDCKIGINASFGTSESALLLSTNIGIDNTCGPYISCSIGIRLRPKTVLCTVGVISFAIIAIPIMAESGTTIIHRTTNTTNNYYNTPAESTYWVFESGSENIKYNHFNRVTIYNNTNKEIDCNEYKVSANNNRYISYVEKVTIISKQNINKLHMTYIVNNGELILYLENK